MLKFVEEKEYLDTIRFLNEELNLETGFKPEITHRKNSLKNFFVKMISEDWTDTLQGIISAELYETKKGYFLSIDTLYVTPENRGNKYGEILILNLLNNVKDECKNLENNREIVAISNVNLKSLKSFKENGFEVGAELKNRIKVSKIL